MNGVDPWLFALPLRGQCEPRAVEHPEGGSPYCLQWGNFCSMFPPHPPHLLMSLIPKEADVTEASWRVHQSHPPLYSVPTRSRYHSRDADLEEIVLDQLLAQHDDAQLDAELHEAAARSTLWDRGQVRSSLALGRG